MSSADATAGAPASRAGNLAWLALVALTLTTFGFGEAGMGGGAVAAALLAIAFVKGHLVVHWFMGLKDVRLAWRLVMAGWLVFVLCGIGIAYWMGAR